LANAGYIIVKGGDARKKEDRRDYKQFYGPLDKGSNKPTFCYPQRKQNLEEEVNSMQKAVDMGVVTANMRLQFEASLKQKKDRLEAIKENDENAKKLFEKDKDQWVTRRKELAEEISNGMPSRKDVKDRRVNPHRVLKDEKGGLGEKKKEFIVLSRLMDAESNVSFLQRD
jgi:hypothetical protein